MFKKIISKFRVSYQEKNLEKISGASLNFDMRVKPLVISSLGLNKNNKPGDIVFKNVAPGTYRLLLSSNIKSIFNQRKIYASFDISDVLKIDSKQFRLGIYNYSNDKGIFEYFEDFSIDDNVYGVITLKIPRFIKYLHVMLEGNNPIDNFGLETIFFGNVNSPLYKVFQNKADDHKNIDYENTDNKKTILNWKRFDLVTNSKVEIRVSSIYENIAQDTKKAILLFKLYDFSGNEVKDKILDNVGLSSHYNTYFKYIPDTKDQYLTIHSFTVPENISYIELSQVAFDVKNSEQVTFKDIQVSHIKEALPNILDTQNIELASNSELLEFEKEVIQGKKIEFFANIKYNSPLNNKKGLLLLRFYDKNKEPLDYRPNNLLWIEKYSSYYKYLPDTDEVNLKVYDCEVPKEASFIRVGLIGFNLKSEESLTINTLCIKYENRQIENKVRTTAEFISPSDSESEISILGWQEDININRPTVLGIMDEFTQGCFAGDVNLIQPRTDNWYALSEKYQPDLIFIESAWKGNSGNWQYRVSKYSNKPGLEVSQLCNYSKKKSIPTVFWNKEDPVHHDRFMDSAAEAEYIFTTDENMITSYQSKTGNSKVYTLPFAAQPLLHKPKSLIGRKNKSCFAGSWYGNRHAERGAVIVWLLDAAKKYGLDIYDRNYTLGHSPFPPKYQKHVIGSLPYLDLCEEYRNYRVFLNVNSVTNSPTMFSRRVFELMACGTPVVSTYSQGIKELFNSEAVWLVDSEKEAYEALKILMTDDKEWRRRSLAGIREIFQYHTYAHRLNYIFEKTGTPQRINVSPRVLINIFIENELDIDFVLNFKSSQKYSNYELLITYDERLPLLDNHDLTFLPIKDLPKYLEDNVFDLFGVINSSYRYGDNYLIDLINAYIYEPQANAFMLCDLEVRDKAFTYGTYGLLDGALFKDKQKYLQKLDQYISGEQVDEYQVYFIDSDEFIKR